MRVPKPIEYFRNLLLMEFVGEGGLPCATLVKSVVDKPDAVLRQITRAVRIMTLKAGLVHGDLSPYNVLYDGKHIAVIDMGEAISTKHPEARRLLQRDADIFCKYFVRLGVKTTPEDVFRKMGGEEL